MIVFNNISLKRGQTELLENATATINPKQKETLIRLIMHMLKHKQDK